MRAFKQLTAWKKAHELALRTHSALSALTREHADLLGALRSSAARVLTDVAVGSNGDSAQAFASRLDSAIATLREYDALLRLAHDLAAVDPGDFARLSARADEVARLLVGLRRRVRAQASRRDSGPAPRIR